jgi:hypothetical protein
MISTTMDLWSDRQKTPFMAVTGHWLQATLIDTPAGTQYTLTLRTDLIGFLRVPGHHDGEHLATAFLYIIDRIGIASKVCSLAHCNISSPTFFLAGLDYSRQRHQQRHIHDIFGDRTRQAQNTVSEIGAAHSVGFISLSVRVHDLICVLDVSLTLSI